MGIVRVQVPKAPPPPPKAILITRSYRSGRFRRMHFWSWFCEACHAGQDKMFNDEEARKAGARHRLAKHPETFAEGSLELRSFGW